MKNIRIVFSFIAILALLMTACIKSDNPEPAITYTSGGVTLSVYSDKCVLHNDNTEGVSVHLVPETNMDSKPVIHPNSELYYGRRDTSYGFAVYNMNGAQIGWFDNKCPKGALPPTNAAEESESSMSDEDKLMWTAAMTAVVGG